MYVVMEVVMVLVVVVVVVVVAVVVVIPTPHSTIVVPCNFNILYTGEC